MGRILDDGDPSESLVVVQVLLDGLFGVSIVELEVVLGGIGILAQKSYSL